MKSVASAQPAGAAALVQALRRPRYEVLPVAGVEDEIAASVPAEVTVTVTASPRRGLEATITLTELLSRWGFRAVPHLAARQVVDASHLAEILGRLDHAGVRDAFVVAGDCVTPQGPYHDSLALLTTMNQLGHGLDSIGIAGYPDGHPFISDTRLMQALADKAPLSTYLVSQLCFDRLAISAWVDRIRRAGVQLTVYVGIAGAVDRRRLLRIAARIGVGESTRFLRRHRGAVKRLALPSGYRPDQLVQDLAADLSAARRLDGLHVYTFNNLRATERRRQRLLSRLEVAA